MSGKQTVTIELYPRQIEFLKRMADKYHMSGEAKALRALVDFAIEEPRQEEPIFRQIRCFDC